MSKVIVFELDSDSYTMSSDTAVIYDSFKFENWFRQEPEYKIMFSCKGNKCLYNSIPELINKSAEYQVDTFDKNNIIPVGDVIFTEQFLGKCIKAINIPSELRESQYTDREIAIGNKDMLREMLNRHNRIFIKDAEKCKHTATFLANNSKELEDYIKVSTIDRYFISEYKEFNTEWRVFVFKKQIQDCRMYIGDYRDKPDFKIIEKMINSWSNSPTAYTLDVGKDKEGKTLIIEAHNFLSCGLYGFEDESKIVRMTTFAYKEELTKESW